MKKATLILTLFALLATLPCIASAADGESQSQTLTGQFIWERQDKNIEGPVEAIFEATGENMWNVAFHFTFE